MAEQNKPHDPHDPKGNKAKKPFDMNLELPGGRKEPEPEEIPEVLEVVEEEVPVVSADEVLDVQPVEEVIEVVEVAPASDTAKVDLVEDVQVVGAPSTDTAHEPLVQDVADTPAEAPEALTAPTGKGQPTQLAGKGGTPTMLAPESGAEDEASSQLLAETLWPLPSVAAEQPPAAAEHAEKAMETPAAADARAAHPGDTADVGVVEEIVDVVEALPSSSGKVAPPLVSSADEDAAAALLSEEPSKKHGDSKSKLVDDVVDVVEEADVVDVVEEVEAAPKAAPESDRTIAFEGKATDSGALPPSKPQTVSTPPAGGADDVVVEYEEVLVEGESEVDLGRRPTAKGDRPSGVDIIAEALESGVDLDHAKTVTPPNAKKKLEDSDIAFEHILDDSSAESSAVDLGSSGERPALPSSPSPLKRGRAEDDDHRTHFAGEGEASDIVGDEALEQGGATELHDEEDEEILVTPKKRTVARAAPEEVAEEPAATEEEVVEDFDADALAAQARREEEEAEEAAAARAPARRRRAGDDEEEGGTATMTRERAGDRERKRSGCMPFVMGGFLMLLLVAGGAAAAWFFAQELVFDTLNIQAKKTGGTGVQPGNQQVAATPAQKAGELLALGKYDEAMEEVKDFKGKEGPEGAIYAQAHIRKLESQGKTGIDKDMQLAVEDLKKADKEAAKAAEARQAKELELLEAKKDAEKKQKETQAKLDTLATLLADAKLPAETDKLKLVIADYQKAWDIAGKTWKALSDAKLVADFKDTSPEQYAKAINDVLKKRDELKDSVATLEESLTKVNDALSKAGVKNADTVKAVQDLAALRDAAVKERDTLNVAIDAALKELKDGNYVPAGGDKTTQLVEGTKKARLAGQSPLGSSLSAMVAQLGNMSKNPGDFFKKVFDNTKTAAELKALQAQLALQEPAEHRIDTMVALLGDRGFKDAKELGAFKNYLDWVRSKEAKASPEARAKALLAAALILRNQEDFEGARKTLAEAAKEAEALKNGGALKVAASKALGELSDPAVYYLPRAERRLADGQVKEALEEVSAGLKVLPEHPRLLLRRAQITLLEAATAGKADEALAKRVRDDAEAARKDPALAAESHYVEGRLEELFSHWSKAEEQYRAALKDAKSPGDAERYRIALARVLQRERVGGPAEEQEAPEETAAAETALEVFCDFQPPGGDEDEIAAAKRLKESVDLAMELIKSPNAQTRGEGYMILGIAQARQGKKTEGLKNFVKGLELIYPGAATADLVKMIETHPAFGQPDVALNANPPLAEKHFGKGLDFFWSKKYADAEGEFLKAVSFYRNDARYHYFLGMARWLQGTKDKKAQADFDFQQGVQLEQTRQPGIREINASLERVQGDLRKVLNSYREKSL
jgi:hypothetical protein